MNYLNPARSSANDANALTSKSQAFLGPQRGVMAFALELIEALDIGHVGFCSEPGAKDEVASAIVGTLIRLYVPLVKTWIKLSRRDSRAKLNILAEI